MAYVIRSRPHNLREWYDHIAVAFVQDRPTVGASEVTCKKAIAVTNYRHHLTFEHDNSNNITVTTMATGRFNRLSVRIKLGLIRSRLDAYCGN